MAEYIERDAFLKHICNSCDGYCECVECDCVNCKSEHRCDLVQEFSDYPAADVAPVVHGEWIGVRNGKGVCSHCNRLDSIDPLATHCRYCGADMRERKGDDAAL